jgi:mono/diheme cytochrome c family protein|tara:strand:- start:108 stop:554 length:447 start_codon:yes stop_codon:yes gene_type:complete
MGKICYSALLVILILGCNDTTKKQGVSNLEVTINKVQSPLQQSIDRGAVVYKKVCSQCHRPSGKGIANNYPPLAGSNWLTQKRLESIKAVKYGLKGSIIVNQKPYNGVMSAMGLNNTQVADVMNYTMNSWGNKQKEIVTPKEVASVKK